MLPKNRRIPRKDFSYILKNGKRFNSPHLLVYICPDPNNNLSRFSFSISKKIYKNASDRNLYRRRGYAVIRDGIEDIRLGFLFFFSFKKGSYPLSFTDLQSEISSILRESRVLKLV